MAHVDTSDFITDFNNKDVLDHLVKIELHPETEEQYNIFKKIPICTVDLYDIE